VPQPVNVRPLAARDRGPWQQLWTEYQRFYETILSEEVVGTPALRLRRDTYRLSPILVDSAQTRMIRNFKWQLPRVALLVCLTACASVSRWNNREGSDWPIIPLTPDTTEQASGTWSPNASSVIFAAAIDSQYHLMRFDRRTGSRQRLTYDGRVNGWAGWNRAGKVVFHSTRGGNYHLYMMDSAGGNVRRVTSGRANELQPAWSPSASQIAFVSSRAGNSDIWVMTADGTEERALTTDPRQEEGPAWSPDGRFVAFMRNVRGTGREAFFDIFVVEVATGAERRLTHAESEYGYPSWSPDGKRVVFTSRRDGNLELYSVATDGTRLRRLTDHPADDMYPRWSPGGGEILFQSNRSGVRRLYVLECGNRC
jgi:Tol biopolymer transport system component